ncbi:uncharacterized protein ISCGN_031389 [Ixodes scapularis]
MEGDERKPLPSGMFAVQQPPAFDFDKTAEWPTWSQAFDDYRFASGLNERSEEAQVRTLLYTMGRQARAIFKTFGLSADDEKNYQVVKERFDSHFDAARNIVYESACFHRRSQKPGETVDQFVTALHTVAEGCDFQNLKERMIRDRFVVGLRDAKLSETLQMDADLTLATALAKARLKETIHQQQQELRPGAGDNAVISAAETEVDFVAKKSSSAQGRYKTQDSTRRGVATPQQGSGQRCLFCGKASHPSDQCQAVGIDGHAHGGHRHRRPCPQGVGQRPIGALPGPALRGNQSAAVVKPGRRPGHNGPGSPGARQARPARHWLCFVMASSRQDPGYEARIASLMNLCVVRRRSSVNGVKSDFPRPQPFGFAKQRPAQEGQATRSPAAQSSAAFVTWKFSEPQQATAQAPRLSAVTPRAWFRRLQKRQTRNSTPQTSEMPYAQS